MKFLLVEEDKKEPDCLGEDITLQDKHAVRGFADECKVDGLPLMDYKEFSELLNEQGMKPNEELYQVYVDAYNNEEDTDYIEVIKKKFEHMSSNEIIDLLGIPNSSNIDSDSPMFLLPNGSIISVAQAGKLIGQELSDNIHSDMVYVILSAIAKKYNYDWNMDDRWYEDKKLDYLTYGLDWARLNCGETWAEKRFYCVLPNHMTSAQYRSLEKWLEWGADTGKKEVLVYVGRDEVNQTYYFNETFPEDIIKKIKRYYSSGRLYESRNELKESMNIPNDVEMFYDRHLRLWTLYIKDEEGNQISNTEYAPTKEEALYIANNKGLFNMRESLTMNEEFVRELIPGESYYFTYQNDKILYGTFKRKTPAWLFFDVDGREVLTSRWANVATEKEDIEMVLGIVNKMEKDTKIPSQIPNRFTRVPNQHGKPMGESNELEQRAKKHKKKSKGMGWHMSMNAGDVEKGIEVFNNSTSLGSGSSGGEGTAMGESVEKHLYYYDGPIYYRGNKTSIASDIYTTAKSFGEATRNILFKAAKGDKELWHYDIVDDAIKQMPDGKLERPKCQQCGYEINDNGDCPVCDYGEDDLLESLSDLEALWTLRNLD